MDSTQVVSTDTVRSDCPVMRSELDAEATVSPFVVAESQDSVSQPPKIFLDPPPGDFDQIPQSETVDLAMYDGEPMEAQDATNTTNSLPSSCPQVNIPQPPSSQTMTLLSNQVKTCRIFLGTYVQVPLDHYQRHCSHCMLM